MDFIPAKNYSSSSCVVKTREDLITRPNPEKGNLGERSSPGIGGKAFAMTIRMPKERRETEYRTAKRAKGNGVEGERGLRN